MPRPSSAGDAIGARHDYPGVLFGADDGSFALSPPGCEPGQQVDVQVRAEGYRDARLERVAFKAVALSRPSDAVTLRLRKPASLNVQVLGPSSALRSIKGARVTLSDPFWNVEGSVVKVDWLADPDDCRHEAVTDARGLARFPEVTCPDGLVAVEGDSFATAWARWDGRQSAITIMLEGTGVVEGVALDKNGGGGALISLDGNVPMLTLRGTLDGAFEEDDPQDVWRECSLLPEEGGRFRIEGLPPRRYELSIAWVGRDSAMDGLVFKESNDSFTLEAGQALRLVYPEDEVRKNPERLLAEADSWSSPADTALREQLLGTWTREVDLPGGATIFRVDHFGAGGEWWEMAFRSPTVIPLPGGGSEYKPGHTTTFSGWFTVTGGTVNMFDDTRGHTWFPAAEVRGATLQVPGADFRPAIRMTRAEGAEEALRQGEGMSGVSRDTGLPFAASTVAQPSRSRAGFGQGAYIDQ